MLFVYVYYCRVCCCIFVYLFAISLCLSSTIICKQVALLYCFVFVAFDFYFNVKQCKCKYQYLDFFYYRSNIKSSAYSVISYAPRPCKFTWHCSCNNESILRMYVSIFLLLQGFLIYFFLFLLLLFLYLIL